MESDFQPQLKGGSIELRPLKPDDFAALHAAAGDPLIWEQHPEPNRFKQEVFRKFFDSGIQSKGALAVIDLKSGRVIGSSRYYDYDPGRREVKIGYTFLERAFWGGPCNRELKSLMLDHAFRFVERVLFEVGEDNRRSQKALLKIGAQLLTRTELPDAEGRLTPTLVFALVR